MGASLLTIGLLLKVSARKPARKQSRFLIRKRCLLGLWSITDTHTGNFTWRFTWPDAFRACTDLDLLARTSRHDATRDSQAAPVLEEGTQS